MQQPELGNKINELRQQKGFTQEDLADKCYLNVRSIQRIEAGEVIPRLSTLKILSEVLEFKFNQNEKKNVDLWIVFLHLTNLIPLVVIALFIWVWKKDEIPGLHDHGVAVLNFQITMFIALILMIPLLPLIGPFVGLGIWLITIINIVKVSMHQPFKYPLSHQFIKQ